jgi:hypothetical protein
MTEREALAEAQRLWGDAGEIYDRADHPDTDWHELTGQKWVGAPMLGNPLDVDAEGNVVPATHPFGNGATWEAAFADAIRRKAMAAGEISGSVRQ